MNHDKVNNRTILLSLILVLVLALIITSSQVIMWGHETIVGGDQVRHLDRAMAILHGKIDIFHLWDSPNTLDLYPRGYHILIASVGMVLGIDNPYVLSIIFKSLFFSLIILLYFILGNKIDPKIGILAAFFRTVIFGINTNLSERYVFLSATQTYLSTAQITEITLLISIYCIFSILFKKDKSSRRSEILPFALIFVIFSTLHGVSHISTFMGFVVNVLAFMMFIVLLNLRTKQRRLLFMRVCFIISLTVFSSVLALILFYLQMIPTIISSNDYDLSPLLPKQLLNFVSVQSILNFLDRYTYALLILSLLSSLIFFYLLNTHKKKSISAWLPQQNPIRKLIIGYVILYILTTLIMTINYHKFTSLQYLGTYYPLYLNFLNTSHPAIALPAILIGLLLFSFSVIGLFYLSKLDNPLGRFFAVLYVYAFFMWFIFLVVIGYYGNRFGIFGYFVPFLFAGAIIWLYEYLSRESKSRKFSGSLFSFLCSNRSKIIVIILLSMLMVNVVIQINREPVIREMYEGTTTLRFGPSKNPTICTPSFAMRVNDLISADKNVLATRQTSECLSALTQVRVPDTHYRGYKKEHTNYYLLLNAIRNYQLKQYFDTFGDGYFVVGVSDLKCRTELTGKRLDMHGYESDSNLIRVYHNSNDERIYMYNSNS